MRDTKNTDGAEVVLGEDWVTNPSAVDRDLRSQRSRRGLISINRSPLARKIITFNLLGLIVLVAGVLYLNPFRDSLVWQHERGLVAEAELMKQAAEKARSASFSVPAQQFSRLQDEEGTQSQQELNSPDHDDSNCNGQQQQLGMPPGRSSLIQDGENGSNNSPKARLKASQQSRRSQSCRVASSKNASRPHVRRRLVQGEGSANSSATNIDNQETSSTDVAQKPAEADSYNPFLRKVPSCGRLLALAPEDCMYVQDDTEDSPVPL